MKSNFWDQLMRSDDGAAHYMDTYGEGIGTKVRQEILAFINEGESVLDVGAGPGWNMESFSKVAGIYKGVDYSARFVRVANARRKKAKIGVTYAFPFEVQDCRHLKEASNSWQVVVLQDCLEHTNGFKVPMEEALRVARKRVIVTFWHLTDTDSPHINDDGNDGWGAWYDKREWEKFLDGLGYHWLLHEFEFPEGRSRHLYVIDKEPQ